MSAVRDQADGALAPLKRMARRARVAVSARSRPRRRGGEFEARLVWLVGSPRSGSTWLLKLLAEHPRTVTINEPLIGEHLGAFLSDQPGISPDALDLSTFTTIRLRSDASAYFFSERYRGVWEPLLAELIRERIRAQVSGDRGKPLVVIKEPHGSQAADIILRALPRSRLLFLLRDGRDVIDSEAAAFAQGSWLGEAFGVVGGIGRRDRLEFVEGSAYKWLWRTQVVEEAFARHPGAKYQLRYEELRAQPEKELRGILEWLGLPSQGRDIESWVARHRFEEIPEAERGPDKFFRSATPGGWRQGLSADEQERVHGIIGAKLRELGYE
jgi:hypothetical protein